MKKIPEATAAIMTGSINQPRESGFVDDARRKGDMIPDFDLPDARGRQVWQIVFSKKGVRKGYQFPQGGFCLP